MTGSRRKVAFLHTAPPAIPPLVKFYSEAAPDLEISHMMEDGLLKLLAAGRHEIVLERLRAMGTAARDTYDAELAMITCSSVPLQMASVLRGELAIPVLKIDGPMARMAVEAGPRVGIAATFRPTIQPTSTLLTDTAAALGREVELVTEFVEGAYDALFSGDLATHDRLLLEGVRRLTSTGVQSVVLAQVSMARIRDAAQAESPVPVLSSMDTSLAAIRELLA
jgi:hypothetical protein